MESGENVHFQCFYCDETFTLTEKQVFEVEKIAVIKCPKCNRTEDIVELAKE